MGLQDILSISGKGGLFKLVGSMKNGVIVESIVDGKRIPAHAHNRISALADISIYGEDGEKPLSEVMKAVLIRHNGEAVPFKDWDGEELKNQFREIFPEYDEGRVYTSDLKKVYQWTNLLIEKEIINLEWANTAEVEEAEVEETKKEASKK